MITANITSQVGKAKYLTVTLLTEALCRENFRHGDVLMATH